MFDTFVYLLSSAVEKQAPLRKVFLKKKTPKLLKATWFDHDCKNLLVKPNSPMKGAVEAHLLIIGLLLAEADWNSQML